MGSIQGPTTRDERGSGTGGMVAPGGGSGPTVLYASERRSGGSGAFLLNASASPARKPRRSPPWLRRARSPPVSTSRPIATSSLRTPARLPLPPLRHPRRLRCGAAGALGPGPLPRRCGWQATRRVPRLRDVYDLDLAADLVVLSGCRRLWARSSAAKGSWDSPGFSTRERRGWWQACGGSTPGNGRAHDGVLPRLWIEGLASGRRAAQARLSLARQHRSAIRPTGEPLFSRGLAINASFITRRREWTCRTRTTSGNGSSKKPRFPTTATLTTS